MTWAASLALDRLPPTDVFTGFNLFSIALEIPMSDIFPKGIPHNGQLQADSTDSLLRVWSSISRRETQTVDASNVITGLKGSGEWVQVGRNALPLFNAGLVGTQRQTLYLRTSPLHDVSSFGADILFPVLVRDAEALGIYKALGVPDERRRHAQGTAAGHRHRDQSRAVRFPLLTVSLVTSSRSTPRSIRASRTAAGSVAGPRRTRIR